MKIVEKWNKGDDMKGYKVIKDTHLPELDSRVLLLEHEKTKARVMKMENKDENKTFAVGFKTVQNDDTGICHILEHSVLSGSRKYKTKEPFMDLIKHSLQTFVNAMTFADKTIYPVSSRNTKDFHNLMDVYLDAVFHPAIFENPKIFQQEGWHYELENAEDPLTVTGVVYNEMKGAMSSDMAQVNDLIARHLYPGSTYCTNSGGDPAHIIDLEEKELLEYHKKHYHPTNSYIFLWGDGNTEEELAHLSEFLDEFEEIELKDEMKPIQPLKETIIAEDRYYGEEKEKNDFLVVSYIAGDQTSILDALTHEFLTKLLITEEGAPIKDRILSEGLGTDVTTTYSVGDKLNFSVIVKEMDRASKGRILQIIDEELEKIAEGTLDQRECQALLHQMKYDAKTFGDTTFIGGYAYIMSLDAWLYDGDPVEYLALNKTIDTLESRLEILQDYVRTHLRGPRMELTIVPDANLMNEKEEALKERLANYKASLGEDEIEKIMENTKALHAFQLKEDSPEEKATIPQLSVKDLKKTVSSPAMEQDGNLLWTKGFTMDICYVNGRTWLPLMDKKVAQGLQVISYLIGRVDTEDYSYKELNTEINLLAYDFDTSFAFGSIHGEDKGTFTFVRSISAERDDFKAAYQLFDKVHTTSKFTNAKRIKEILQGKISRDKLAAVMGGVSITVDAALQDIAPLFGLHEAMAGASYIHYLEDLVQHSDEELVQILEEAYENYIQIWKANTIFHVTGEEAEQKAVKETLEALGIFGDEPHKKPLPMEYKPGKDRAITTLTDVNYCVDAGPMVQVKGSYRVAANLLSNFYLHNHIRAKGGAYGDGISMRGGFCFMFSYRDPNVTSTREVFENAPQWLRDQNPSQEEIDSLIIGTYNSFDPHLTMKQKGERNFGFYISNKTEEDINQELKEALQTSVQDIHAFGDALEAAMKQKGRAVFTNEKTYGEHRTLFDDKVELQ